MDDLIWYPAGMWIGGVLIGIFIGANEQDETPGQVHGFYSLMLGIIITMMAISGFMGMVDGPSS